MFFVLKREVFWKIQAPKWTRVAPGLLLFFGHNPRLGEHISCLDGHISFLGGSAPKCPPWRRTCFPTPTKTLVSVNSHWVDVEKYSLMITTNLRNQLIAHVGSWNCCENVWKNNLLIQTWRPQRIETHQFRLFYYCTFNTLRHHYTGIDKLLVMLSFSVIYGMSRLQHSSRGWP